MKKIIVLVVLVLIVGGGVAYFLTKDDSSDKTNKDQANTSQASAKADEACKLFTEADAKRILGADAKSIGSPELDQDKNQNKEVAISNCTYSTEAKTAADIPNVRSASIMMRIPLTDNSKADNKKQFEALKPTDKANDVSGYGESAFWNPTFGQLNILVNDNWLIISNGSGAPSDRSLDDAKKVADIVVPKLQ